MDHYEDHMDHDEDHPESEASAEFEPTESTDEFPADDEGRGEDVAEMAEPVAEPPVLDIVSTGSDDGASNPPEPVAIGQSPLPDAGESPEPVDVAAAPSGTVTRIDLPPDVAVSAGVLPRPSEAAPDFPPPPDRGAPSSREPDSAAQPVASDGALAGSSGGSAHVPGVVTAPEEPLADIGQPMPRVQVFVTVAEARSDLEEVVAVAAEALAPEFQQIAGREVWYSQWVRQSEERAADYRLRGPS